MTRRSTVYLSVSTPSVVPVRRRTHPAYLRDRLSTGTRADAAYAAMVDVVVRPNKVLKLVDVPHRLIFRKVSPHASFLRLIEPFDDTRLGLLVVSGKLMDDVLLQQTLNGKVQEFGSFIGLQRRGPGHGVGEQTFQRRHQ